MSANRPPDRMNPMSPDRGNRVESAVESSYDPAVDGVHDLGGLDGFGPVEHAASEPMFDADWERRTLRMVLGSIHLVGGAGGRFRHSIERIAKLTGRRLDDGDDRMGLWLALKARAALP